MEVNMLFKNNNLRPAFATVGTSDRVVNRRPSNDAVMYNTDSYSDTSNFGGFNEENTRDRAPRKKAPAAKGGQANKKSNGNIPYWVWLVIVAAVVVVLLFALVISVAFNSTNNIEMTDNTYIAYTEDGQTYRIATNGSVLDSVFESEPIITPSLDHSFAYVECEGEDGIMLYLLRDKKLEEITMEGSSVTKVIAYAQLKPGIVYEEEGKYYIYTENMGEDLIVKTEGADNFLISDDASTVVYTLPIEDSADEYKMYSFRNGTSDAIGVKNCKPIMLSADGEYIYGQALTASSADKLYCITLKDGEKYPVGEGFFGGITAINVDGDEIMYYAINDTRFTTYIYNAKKDTSYEIAKNYGIFTPVSPDTNVVRYGSFKDVYVESFSLGGLADSEGAISGYTYYINKKYEAEPIAKATGKFSPDGDYFYYINARGTLYQVDLSKRDETDKKIFEDTVKFEITQKGNIYMLISDSSESGLLYYYKPSTGSKKAINKVTTEISMHNYANKLYYTTEEDQVFVTEEGSKGEPVKFDSIQLINLPYFSTPDSKKTFAYYYDEETMLWSIFYTSNGKSFDLITSECESVWGSLIDDILNGNHG
jgi:hypothetical protein